MRATFKVVGEKARVLEQRGRWDVVRALSAHEIGYHSNWHSVPPHLAVYLRDLGFVEGAAEFERREAQGAHDVERVFGVRPACYGQPGSSWGPQANPALRRMGIPVYLDEGEQVGLDEQPFWYDGMLYVFHMGRFSTRAPLDGGSVPKSHAEFDRAADLAARGGGVISIYYHPTEFVTTEFWDGVNFAKGANPERHKWRLPHRRTAAESERCYGVLREYVAHMKGVAGVRFVTARDLQQIYEAPAAPRVARDTIATHLAARQTWLRTPQGTLSAADMLQVLLGMEPQVVDGPATRIASTYSSQSIGRAAFKRAKADVVAFIRTNQRLPAEVWIGAEKLSPGDFAATLAADDGASADVAVRRGESRVRKVRVERAATLLQLAHTPGGFRGARAARPRAPASLDDQARAAALMRRRAPAPHCTRCKASGSPGARSSVPYLSRKARAASLGTVIKVRSSVACAPRRCTACSLIQSESRNAIRSVSPCSQIRIGTWAGIWKGSSLAVTRSTSFASPASRSQASNFIADDDLSR